MAGSEVFERDPLTGVYTRQLLSSATIRHAMYEYPVSVVMGDINGLKLINDVLGHGAGNEAILRIVKILKKVFFGSTHYILRVGGDEFLILLPGCGREQTASYIHDVQTTCEAGHKDIGNTTLVLGSVTYNGAEGERTIEELIELADADMYKKKLKESIRVKRAMERHIMQALRKSAFEPMEHTTRMVRLAGKLAPMLGMSQNELRQLKLLCWFHDMGKLSIPKEVTAQCRGCSAEADEVLRSHAEKGFNIARGTFRLIGIAPAILMHHENYNGSGYPLGFKGEHIPFLARILRVIHHYEDLTHPLVPLAASLSHSEALGLTASGSGVEFDPDIAAAFIKAMEVPMLEPA